MNSYNRVSQKLIYKLKDLANRRMLNLEDWPKGWGILFATFVTDKVYGRTRLNKFLYLMQREGFPIENKFIIEKMGPYDKNIGIQAEKFEKGGFISIDEKGTEHDSPLYIYTITDEGKKYTKESINPLINSLPDRLGFNFSFSLLKDFVVYTKINKIVEHIHKELFIDNRDQFISQLNLTINQIIEKLDELEKDKMDYCQNYLNYLGFFEFTKDSIETIIKKKKDDKFVGKNIVLFNAIELINRFDLEKKLSEKYFNDCREKGYCSQYPCVLKNHFLNHRFHCIEFNSDLYGIKESIDYVNTDFRKLFNINS